MPIENIVAGGILAKGALDAASAFLSRVCLRAAEEFGLFFKDKVAAWRQNNAVKVVNEAQKIIELTPEMALGNAHPRLIWSILEHSSWTAEDAVQKMWAGILASSCSGDADEGNLIFINILSQLTALQAKVLAFSCKESVKMVVPSGWVHALEFYRDLEFLKEFTGVQDLHRLDRELDHLRSLALIVGGFDPHSTNANLTPTPLALHFYVRCQGDSRSPVQYFNLKLETDSQG